MKTDLCIFDLDGTLLDTIDDIANSMNRILSANDYPTHSVKWYRDSVGNGAKNLLLDSLPAEHGLSDEKVGELLKVFKADYHENCAVLTKPYDGIPELLKYLVENSVKIAVITNKLQSITETMLKRYFEEIEFITIYGDGADRPIKPDPIVAETVLSIAKSTPDKSIYIGDSEIDMLFAQRSSIFSIGVLWGFRDRSVLEEFGANAIVEKPVQIIEHIIR